MYHKIDDQEKNPENYVLKEVNPNALEDEVHDLLSRPRQTQRTVGLYLKKIKDTKDECREATKEEMKRFSLGPGSIALEEEVRRNKGFWVDRPELYAPLTYKLKEHFSVDVKRNTAKEQGIFFRPKYLELEYLMELARAGKLYNEEEFSDDSDEELQPDESPCVPLRKQVYKICDPCKEVKQKKEKEELKPPKDLLEAMRRKGVKPPFKRIPSGCECNYYGEHNRPLTVWDTPFEDEMEVLRQHELNKVLKPYKHELMKKNYEAHPPILFKPHQPGKKTFPVYQISNL